MDDVLVWHCPWNDAEPQPVAPRDVEALLAQVRAQHVERALILTRFHQSALTLALLRLAGVPWSGATSTNYPGTLLDLRHRLPGSCLHEVERMLSLAAAAGHPLPP